MPDQSAVQEARGDIHTTFCNHIFHPCLFTTGCYKDTEQIVKENGSVSIQLLASFFVCTKDKESSKSSPLWCSQCGNLIPIVRQRATKQRSFFYIKKNKITKVSL